jgi:predicted membrane-bound spermidine synthase
MPQPDRFRDDERPVVVERRRTERGELVLRRAGAHFEVIADGTFLMDTRDGRSERALVREALPDGAGLRVLLGGLGVEWARTHLRGLCEHGLDDPRVRLVVADLRDALAASDAPFDAICLDIDNGPGWLVHPENAAVYADAGLLRLAGLLAPGGRLAVWAAAADEGFAARLRARFGAVRSVAIAVPRGPDDVVYVAERPAVSPATNP